MLLFLVTFLLNFLEFVSQSCEMSELSLCQSMKKKCVQDFSNEHHPFFYVHKFVSPTKKKNYIKCIQITFNQFLVRIFLCVLVAAITTKKSRPKKNYEKNCTIFLRCIFFRNSTFHLLLLFVLDAIKKSCIFLILSFFT